MRVCKLALKRQNHSAKFKIYRMRVCKLALKRQNHSVKFKIFRMRVCKLTLKRHKILVTLNLPTSQLSSTITHSTSWIIMENMC